jgi:hypothetical protein
MSPWLSALPGWPNFSRVISKIMPLKNKPLSSVSSVNGNRNDMQPPPPAGLSGRESGPSHPGDGYLEHSSVRRPAGWSRSSGRSISSQDWKSKTWVRSTISPMDGLTKIRRGRYGVNRVGDAGGKAQSWMHFPSASAGGARFLRSAASALHLCIDIPQHRHPDLASADPDHFSLNHYMKPGTVLFQGHRVVRRSS